MTKKAQSLTRLKGELANLVYFINTLDRRNIYSIHVKSKGLGYPIVPAEEEGCVHKDVKKRC